MRARAFWRIVTADHVDLLDRFLALLRETDTAFCLIGGQAVNAYVEPVVSLDLDVVIAATDLTALLPTLRRTFTVEALPHRLQISQADSDLLIQIHTDRYETFLARAVPRVVLGLTLPVAHVEDVLQWKIWAAADATRRRSQRLQDRADIARLLEQFPELGPVTL